MPPLWATKPGPQDWFLDHGENGAIWTDLEPLYTLGPWQEGLPDG